MENERQIGIPIDPSDVRQSTEVPIKHIEVETIEYVGKPVKTKKTLNPTSGFLGDPKSERFMDTKKERKTRKKKTEKMKKTETEDYELELKKDSILIITEKPQAAAKIAAALSHGKERKLNISGIPYFELRRDNQKILVASAVGHLFGLDQKSKGSGYPVFDIEWKPSYENKKSSWTKKYYQALAKLCRQAKSFIIATDYDVEGEVIGLNILKYIAKQKDAKRMKYSTLTSDELEESYNNLMPTIDWPQAIAGETRHFLDWMYGINLSRALMQAIRSTGKFRIMSVGRVQGPALNLIVEKEISINSFVSTPYWQVYIILDNGLELKYEKDITKKQELEKFENLKGKSGKAITTIKQQNLMPPTPFDLTSLQIEAYKFFGINPNITLQIAQNLYLSGIISYPRTSSQKIPTSIQPKKIISRLASSYETKLCIRNNPIEGKKSDPAHPSIYPTGEHASLSGDDAKIYDLIARRFLSCFCGDALVENKTIEVIANNLRFLTRGAEIKEKGWLQMYKAKLQEKEIPTINGNVLVKDSRTEEKMTQPPHRYTPASLVSELEKRNLGTKATRSSIVQTLYDRGYIKNQSIEATPIGISLISSLKKYSPIIIDEALTRKIEKEMNNIQESHKNLNEKQEKIVQEAKNIIIKISDEFRKKEKNIGEALIGAQAEQRENDRKEAELQECEKCKKGKLRILFNRNFKRYFVACSNYPECKTTFTLPNGLVKRTDKVCEQCGWPKLLLIKKARRPWEFCFNPTCPSKKQAENNKED